MKKNKAFTLAEIIVVLTLLGVVAAITIPNTLDNSSKKSNMVRVKKALPVFERAIEQMRIVNNISNIATLKTFAESNECENIRNDFKIKRYVSEMDGYNGTSRCQFQTNDGVWWNLSNIEKPIISPLKDGYKYLTADYADKPLTDEEGKNAFYLTLMQGDGSLGYAFLANDPNHESEKNKCDIKKTFAYAKIIKESEVCNEAQIAQILSEVNININDIKQLALKSGETKTLIFDDGYSYKLTNNSENDDDIIVHRNNSTLYVEGNDYTLTDNVANDDSLNLKCYIACTYNLSDSGNKNIDVSANTDASVNINGPNNNGEHNINVHGLE